MDAAVPYVTGVGGTALYLTSSGAYDYETLWPYSGTPKAAIGGGGGISRLFTQPSWQTGYGVGAHANGYRQVPDVSAVASQFTPWAFIYDGKPVTLGGTSLSTPLWAVNTMLIDESLGETAGFNVFLGNLDPALYAIGNWFENPDLNYTGGFVMHDISAGGNGVYATGEGYDPCSGWGSARFGRLLNDLGMWYGFAAYQPDWAPYQPSGWNSAIMFNAKAGTVGEPASFEAGVKYYVGVGCSNFGRADAPPEPFVVILNGVTVFQGLFPSLPLGVGFQNDDITSLTLQKGLNTIFYLVNGQAYGRIITAN
jgi:subtilase family serine protease